ncbi:MULTISPECIES: hypothetical protein [unclassified Roseovarius]|uniref:hypothetical protein n=1 Tax=unclassified Roseovarius TaxID=2614913 RepID=UPI00273E0152|nr:hypothetical protein [Roseovarius sp. MMSF_3350]
MSMTDTRRPALRNDLYIRSEELPGTPAVDAGAATDIENNADTLIRQLLIEEKRRAAPERLPDIAPQEEVLTYDEPTLPRREPVRESIAQILKAERAGASAEVSPPRGRLRLPRLTLSRRTVAETPQCAPARPAASEAAAPVRTRTAMRLPVWLRTYRPTKKHVAWAVVAALVLYRPLMVPLAALLLVWLVLIAYLSLGPDRWGEIIGGAWHRLHARNPELAERVRQRADRFAEKFDRLLDWLPASWAERLALPDFSGADDPDENRPDPFDRLAAEARES